MGITRRRVHLIGVKLADYSYNDQVFPISKIACIVPLSRTPRNLRRHRPLIQLGTRKLGNAKKIQLGDNLLQRRQIKRYLSRVRA